jgi:uncharacterized protein
MKIPIRDILEVPSEIAYPEPVDDLNAELRRGRESDYQFVAPLRVDASLYRAERDLFFDGSVEGDATGTCARCLEPFPLHVSKPFSVILTPEKRLAGEIELAPGDLAQSFYSGPDLDLTPLVYEQILLALPTRPLCAEECRGLCPSCGVNRNTEQCACSDATGDPRLAVLRSLKIDRGA